MQKQKINMQKNPLRDFQISITQKIPLYGGVAANASRGGF